MCHGTGTSVLGKYRGLLPNSSQRQSAMLGCQHAAIVICGPVVLRLHFGDAEHYFFSNKLSIVVACFQLCEDHVSGFARASPMRCKMPIVIVLCLATGHNFCEHVLCLLGVGAMLVGHRAKRVRKKLTFCLGVWQAKQGKSRTWSGIDWSIDLGELCGNSAARQFCSMCAVWLTDIVGHRLDGPGNPNAADHTCFFLMHQLDALGSMMNACVMLVAVRLGKWFNQIRMV